MIAHWMLYAILVSAVVTVAAHAAERTLRLWQRQARLVWGAAMTLSIGIPLVSLAQATGLLPSFEIAAISPTVAGPVAAMLPGVSIGAPPLRVDLVLAVVWLGLSLVLALRFVVVSRALARQRAAWRPAMVDGYSILVSRDAGPAVVGFRLPAVVIPDWVLELDASLRALVLRHEREHLERGDPRALVAAVTAAVCIPWNVALWYQLARLRSAMELDCDARVLRAHPDSRTYGSLLLAVAQRADRGGLLAPGFIEAKSLLARRIGAMRAVTPRHRLGRSVALGIAAVVLGIVACDLRSPTEPSRPAATAARAPAQPAYFEFQVEHPATTAPGSAQPRYPDLLRRAGVEGEVLAQFVVEPDGRVDMNTFKVLKSSHDLFTSSVKAALPQMRFVPAKVGDRAVRQLVQSPFTYTISR